MKAWIAQLLWDAMAIFLARVHDWIFSPERSARIRFANREKWWRYRQRAAETKSPRDDMRANSWAITFDFKTPPTVALARGDLDASARKLAMDAVEANRIRNPHWGDTNISGPHVP